MTVLIAVICVVVLLAGAELVRRSILGRRLEHDLDELRPAVPTEPIPADPGPRAPAAPPERMAERRGPKAYEPQRPGRPRRAGRGPQRPSPGGLPRAS